MPVLEPNDVEEYENGDVNLKIYRYDEMETQAFLKIGGCCGLQLKQKQFIELVEMIKEFENYEF